MVTFDDAIQTCQDLGADTTSAGKTLFIRLMNVGYKLLLADFGRPNIERTYTSPTRSPSNPLVFADRVYQLPPDYLFLKSVKLTVGSQDYPLMEEESQEYFDFDTSIQQTGIPSRYFLRPRFGVSGAEVLLDCIPSASGYTLTVVYEATDRDLSKTVINNSISPANLTFTQASNTIASNNSIFTSSMVGEYINCIDGDGFWYRITAYNSPTSLTIENYYQAVTMTSSNWTINELFNVPEEMGTLPVYFALWHYYMSKKDSQKSADYKNLYDEGLQRAKDRWATKSRGNIIRSKRGLSRWTQYPRYFPSGGVSS